MTMQNEDSWLMLKCPNRGFGKRSPPPSFTKPHQSEPTSGTQTPMPHWELVQGPGLQQPARSQLQGPRLLLPPRNRLQGFLCLARSRCQGPKYLCPAGNWLQGYPDSSGLQEAGFSGLDTFALLGDGFRGPDSPCLAKSQLQVLDSTWPRASFRSPDSSTRPGASVMETTCFTPASCFRSPPVQSHMGDDAFFSDCQFPVCL